jgi:uncharacterized protein YbcC (UPF0753/DUF2309 family)
MTSQASVTEWADTTSVSPALFTPALVAEALVRAGRKVAPLWPLRSFVAVNPFVGLADLDFATATETLGRVAGARTTMPRSFYAQAIAEARITDRDLKDALAEAWVAGAPRSVTSLKAAAQEPGTEFPLLPTVTDLARELDGKDWSHFVTERFSEWAAAHFDAGQAPWRSPWQKLSPYAAWRAEARLDRCPEAAGLAGFRKFVDELPEDANDAASALLADLGVPAAGLDAYLHRLLMTISGWAAFARSKDFAVELEGEQGRLVAELLAVRVVWEAAFLALHRPDTLGAAWRERRKEYAEASASKEPTASLAVDLTLHAAYEKAVQRRLLTRLEAAADSTPAPERPLVHAAFCIDVRSEVLRRALETVDSEATTTGFAGFFGFPFEYVPFGHDHGGAHCPVLLTPKFVIGESLKGASAAEQESHAAARQERKALSRAFRSFKVAAVSSFAFVEALGLTYAAKLLTDTLGWTRPTPHPKDHGLDRHSRGRLGPQLEQSILGERLAGLNEEEQVATAEAVLRAMSMTDGFARLVLLAGHGSSTVNNPHASGLDCGACGGHTGAPNARVAALVLNAPAVREGLVARGIHIPDDTVFVAGLHDTTTDDVTLFDKELVPVSHQGDLTRLEDRLAEAARLARAERARHLHLDGTSTVDAAILARSRDWSQVRPEWGLAGCAAFVVAPRHRTAGVDLGGRSFLHSYDWRKDKGFRVLELIMTAPMVVVSWISLQYYGSTVDNAAFGSGNKALHNVVGTVGVLEGFGGDLRVGLPLQSLHDGAKYVHEPVRMSVLIEAPVEAINGVLAKHESVRQLVDNGWLHLFALDDSGSVTRRYVGNLQWQSVAAPGSRIAA